MNRVQGLNTGPQPASKTCCRTCQGHIPAAKPASPQPGLHASLPKWAAACSPSICLHIAGDVLSPRARGGGKRMVLIVFSSVSLTPCGFHPGQLQTGREQREEAQPSHSSQPHHGWSGSITEMESKLHSEERFIGGQGRRTVFKDTKPHSTNKPYRGTGHPHPSTPETAGSRPFTARLSQRGQPSPVEATQLTSTPPAKKPPQTSQQFR